MMVIPLRGEPYPNPQIQNNGALLPHGEVGGEGEPIARNLLLKTVLLLQCQLPEQDQVFSARIHRPP